MTKQRTARDGRKGATYPCVETGESEAQPNQRIPKITGSGNTRKQYDAYQGDREETADPVGSRKPTN